MEIIKQLLFLCGIAVVIYFIRKSNDTTDDKCMLGACITCEASFAMLVAVSCVSYVLSTAVYSIFLLIVNNKILRKSEGM